MKPQTNGPTVLPPAIAFLTHSQRTEKGTWGGDICSHIETHLAASFVQEEQVLRKFGQLVGQDRSAHCPLIGFGYEQVVQDYLR